MRRMRSPTSGGRGWTWAEDLGKYTPKERAKAAAAPEFFVVVAGVPEAEDLVDDGEHEGSRALSCFGVAGLR